MPSGGVTIVFDENISHKMVQVVSSCSICRVTSTKNQGWNAAEDDVWMPRAAQMRMVVLTCDRNERSRETKVADFREMGARVIFLGAFFASLDRWGRIKWLVRNWERIAGKAAEMPEGTCSLIGNSGRIKDITHLKRPSRSRSAK